MDLDFATIKPSVVNFLILGLMILLWANLSKWFVTKFRVPYVTELVLNQ